MAFMKKINLTCCSFNNNIVILVLPDKCSILETTIYSTILLHFQPVATFPGLLFNDSAVVSTGSDFPRFYYHDDFTTILYGSDIPINYF